MKLILEDVFTLNCDLKARAFGRCMIYKNSKHLSDDIRPIYRDTARVEQFHTNTVDPEECVKETWLSITPLVS